MKFAVVIFASLLFLTLATAAARAANAAPGKATHTSEKNAATVSTMKKPMALPKEVKKLVVEDLVHGAGAEVVTGKKLKVQYTGWLYDASQPQGRGAQFDTSVGGAPFEFTLGVDPVIRGWQEGLLKMKVGGKRRLIIPSEMGYGVRGAGGKIPPNAPLLFEVELTDVADAPKAVSFNGWKGTGLN